MKRGRVVLPLVAGAGIATSVALRARTLRAVAADLRTPDLWLPLVARGTVMLTIGRRLFTVSTEVEPGVAVEQHEIPGGLDAFVYEPQGRTTPGPALVWVHGGGMVGGQPEGEHELASRIAVELGIVVMNVRYRLAPEHPFPAGFDDCYAALRWVVSRTDQLGIDPSRIAVGGASAGGGLAAGLAQRAHDDGIAVAFQLLLYPMLDDRTTRTDQGSRGRIGWRAASNAFAWRSYLGHEPGVGATEPYAAPARRTDLSGLAPTWIGVGDLDLFFAEDITYADRLRAAGVDCELDTPAGMYHAADYKLAATVPSMADFRNRMLAALARGLGVQRRSVSPAGRAR